MSHPAGPQSPSCPICNGRSTDDDGRPLEFFPFCSERCKLVDLNNWLTGRYFGEEPGHSDEMSRAGEAG